MACWIGVLIAGGCASGNRHHGSARPEIAIQRGSSWSTYTFALPQITGPTAQLELRDGHLHGFLASRALDVRIAGPEATGFGPGGPVNLTVRFEGDATMIDGLWNGGPVHLRLTPGSLRGSVVVARGRTAGRELSCSYTLDRSPPEGGIR